MDRDEILEQQTARVLSELARLEEELDGSDWVVPGSRGQPMPTRLLGELRAHRWLLMRMLEGTARSSPGPMPYDPVAALRAEADGLRHG
jgi:hypothetical protein